MSATQASITLWGRLNSMNVQKVLWVLDRLNLPYERIDAGMQFGVNNTPEYLSLNPNGKVPLLKDGPTVVWESHAICRYLCNQYGGDAIYPSDARQRAAVDQWVDWAACGIIGSVSLIFWQLVRTPEDKRDANKIAEETTKTVASLKVLSQGLTGKTYLANEQLSLADIVLVPVIYRCYGLGLVARDDPSFESVSQWFDRVSAEPEYKKWMSAPLT
jgi:glutathione S-transferase